MSTNVTFCERWKKGDSSFEIDEVVDMFEEEVVAVRSNISRATGKSEIHKKRLHVKTRKSVTTAQFVTQISAVRGRG